MAYVALYRAYRPQTFGEVCGQEQVVKTLRNAIKNNKVAHAYLFSGPRGTGKTTIAKILAKAVNCPNQKDGEPCDECDICKGINKGTITDVIEIDAASNNGVDEIREIRDKVKYLPAEGKYKVYIIDEVHMLSTGAFNALLKTLEEPPAHVIFVLATTEIHKIPATIISRCQRFDFRGVSTKEISERIKYICAKEKVIIEDDAVELIAECAEGGMRDALSMLDEAISFAGEKVTISDVYQVSGSVDYKNIIELAETIFIKDSAKTLSALESIIDLGKEIPKICTDLIAFYRDMLLYKNKPNDSKANFRKKDFQTLALKTSNQKIYFYLNILNEAQNNMKFSNQKRTFIELALVKMSDFVEQIQIDNSEEIGNLSKRVMELEKQLMKRFFEASTIKDNEKQEEIVVNKDDNFEYITTKMIQDILNTANQKARNELAKAWLTLSSIKEKSILLQLKSGQVVASNGEKAVITFEVASKCDNLMKKENKAKALSIINSQETLIKDYLAIPVYIWDVIKADYSAKYKSGISKPELEPVEISVRTYSEETEEVIDEMEQFAKDMFGDNYEIEE